MSRFPAISDAEFRRFVDQHRARCLWFLREGYSPRTPAEREEVLRQIAQHGDREAFLRVALNVALAAHRLSRVLTCSTTPPRPWPDHGLASGDVVFHAGRLGGALPQITG